MKSKTLIELKWFKIIVTIAFVYYLIYNTYFGWNEKPINDYEKYCDRAFQVMIGIAIGKFIVSLTLFIELVVNYISSEAKRQRE